MIVQCKRDTKGKSRENFEALVYVVTSCGHLASDFLVMFGFPIITYILERRGTDIFTIVRISFMKYAGVECLKPDVDYCNSSRWFAGRTL